VLGMSGEYEYFEADAPVAKREQLEWQTYALCAQTDPNLFFSDDTDEPNAVQKAEKIIASKKICAHCDVAFECLHYALEYPGEEGVFGGLSEAQRKKLIDKPPEKVNSKFFAVQALNRRLK